MSTLRHIRLTGLFLPLFLISFFAGNAQTQPQADKILKESKQKFNSLQDMSALLTYTFTNPKMAKPIVKNGELKIKKNKYKILFADEEFWCNGKKVWVYMKPEKEVNVSKFDPGESMSVERVYQIYEKSAKNKFEGEESGMYKVTVFVADDKSDVWKAEIWIGKGSKMLEKGVLFGKNGSQYKYELKNIKSNQGVVDNEFDFDPQKYPGVYVNELD